STPIATPRPRIWSPRSRSGPACADVPLVVHILPHPGGGGESYVDLLEGLDGYVHERVFISGSRRPLAGAPSIAARWRAVSRAARDADLIDVHGDTSTILSLRRLRG